MIPLRICFKFNKSFGQQSLHFHWFDFFLLEAKAYSQSFSLAQSEESETAQSLVTRPLPSPEEVSKHKAY